MIGIIFKVRAVGQRIQTWLNGHPVADIEHGKILKGYFGHIMERVSCKI